MQRFFNQLKS